MASNIGGMQMVLPLLPTYVSLQFAGAKHWWHVLADKESLWSVTLLETEPCDEDFVPELSSHACLDQPA